jgi:hypothetical protein
LACQYHVLDFAPKLRGEIKVDLTFEQNPESEIVCSEIEPQAVCDGVLKALCTAPRNATGAMFAFDYELAESSDPNIAGLIGPSARPQARKPLAAYF